MNVATLDTLAYSKRIQELGLTREQAEGFAELAKEREIALLSELTRQNEASRTDFATKTELYEVRDELKGDIQNLRSELYEVKDELKGDIQNVRSELYEVKDELRGDIQNLRSELYEVRDALKSEIQDVRKDVADTKHEILKWMMGMFVALAAFIVAVGAYIK